MRACESPQTLARVPKVSHESHFAFQCMPRQRKMAETVSFWPSRATPRHVPTVPQCSIGPRIRKGASFASEEAGLERTFLVTARAKSSMPWGIVNVEIDDYHFYHFSHRLPLNNAMDCNGLQRIAKAPDFARIELNHFHTRVSSRFH